MYVVRRREPSEEALAVETYYPLFNCYMQATYNPDTTKRPQLKSELGSLWVNLAILLKEPFHL